MNKNEKEKPSESLNEETPKAPKPKNKKKKKWAKKIDDHQCKFQQKALISSENYQTTNKLIRFWNLKKS